MEITPKMKILIEDADRWLNIKCPGYGWKNWITKGIEANEFPWSCSMVYEDAGHDAIRHIVILCGFGDRLKEFTFTKPGEQPGGNKTMTKEEELKQHAIEFFNWLYDKGYIVYAPKADSLKVYQQFLDSNLSDVERFRMGLVAMLIQDYKTSDYANVDNLLEKVKGFQLP
jgi:hypothetical protein